VRTRQFKRCGDYDPNGGSSDSGKARAIPASERKQREQRGTHDDADRQAEPQTEEGDVQRNDHCVGQVSARASGKRRYGPSDNVQDGANWAAE